MLNLISSERLKSYEKILKITDEQQKIMAYQWSKGLVSSILPALQCLEISLRNAINYNVINNKPRAGKFTNDDFWFKSLSQYHTRKTQQNQIRKQNTRLRKNEITSQKHAEIIKQIRREKSWEEREILKTEVKLRRLKGTAPSHDDIISGLTFGFWTNLLSKSYEDASQEQLWPNLINEIFPNLPDIITCKTKAEQREYVEKRIKYIRDFRNRIFHHEPIWKFFNSDDSGKTNYRDPIYGVNASLSILNKVYNDILEIISWMSLDRLNTLRKHDTTVAFLTLCTKDGLNSYIKPENLKYSYNKSQVKRRKKQIKKSVIEENSIIRITKDEETLLFIDKRNIAIIDLI